MFQSTKNLLMYAVTLTLVFSPLAIISSAVAHPPDDDRASWKEQRDDMKERFQARLDEADVDGDGQISFDEFQLPADDRFADTDQDGNEALSLDEMQNAMIQRVNTRVADKFSRMDSDKNGLVTREEIRQQVFSRMDRNDDGVLGERELNRQRSHKGGSRHRRMSDS